MSASDHSLHESNGGAAEPTNLASELALRVALQTIKERCVSLHQRLAIVEEENLTIKSKLRSSDTELHRSDRQTDTVSSKQSEEALRDELAKVTKEKMQLGEHIAMVTTENRQLWSRLSQLVKDESNRQKSSGDDGVPQPTPTGNVQRLIRSETFTQHSPNVLLRPKPIVATGGVPIVPSSSSSKQNNNDESMEDVSLKQLGGYMGEDKVGNDNDKTLSTLNFGYLNDEASRGGDFSQDLNNCAAGMVEMRQEMKRQQFKLKVLVDLLKERRATPQCSQCRKHREKPETADKGSETDGSLSDKSSLPPIPTARQRPAPPAPDATNCDTSSSAPSSAHINILEQKRLADDRDKMCPLCGKLYSSVQSFDEFVEHVETHFIDDIELDPGTLESNFEFVSNTVGNF